MWHAGQIPPLSCWRHRRVPTRPGRHGQLDHCPSRHRVQARRGHTPRPPAKHICACRSHTADAVTADGHQLRKHEPCAYGHAGLSFYQPKQPPVICLPSSPISAPTPVPPPVPLHVLPSTCFIVFRLHCLPLYSQVQRVQVVVPRELKYLRAGAPTLPLQLERLDFTVCRCVQVWARFWGVFLGASLPGYIRVVGLSTAFPCRPWPPATLTLHCLVHRSSQTLVARCSVYVPLAVPHGVLLTALQGWATHTHDSLGRRRLHEARTASTPQS